MSEVGQSLPECHVRYGSDSPRIRTLPAAVSTSHFVPTRGMSYGNIEHLDGTLANSVSLAASRSSDGSI